MCLRFNTCIGQGAEEREKQARAELEAFKEQLSAEVEQRRQAGDQSVRISELEAQNASRSNKVGGERDGVMLVLGRGGIGGGGGRV